MNFTPKGFNKGKIVYYIDGQRFENTGSQRDGREKAEKYCLDNFLNPNDIQKFDSRTECDYYEYLLEQQKQGVISNLGHHFTLKIQDEFVNCNGDTIPAITYEADFIYKEVATGKRFVVDVKGSTYFIDERFITIKQVFDKLMIGKGLYIKVVIKDKGEWVEWHIGDKKKSQTLIKKQRAQLKELKAQQHSQEIAENKKQREIARLNELRTLPKLTSVQRKRLQELEEKYKV